MNSKATEFKNILKGKYKDVSNIDFELYTAMLRLGWTRVENGGEVYHTSIERQTDEGSVYYAFEGELKWNNDIVKALKLLDRL